MYASRFTSENTSDFTRNFYKNDKLSIPQKPKNLKHETTASLRSPSFFLHECKRVNHNI